MRNFMKKQMGLPIPTGISKHSRHRRRTGPGRARGTAPIDSAQTLHGSVRVRRRPPPAHIYRVEPARLLSVLDRGDTASRVLCAVVSGWRWCEYGGICDVPLCIRYRCPKARRSEASLRSAAPTTSTSWLVDSASTRRLKRGGTRRQRAGHRRPSLAPWASHAHWTPARYCTRSARATDSVERRVHTYVRRRAAVLDPQHLVALACPSSSSRRTGSCVSAIAWALGAHVLGECSSWERSRALHGCYGDRADARRVKRVYALDVC